MKDERKNDKQQDKPKAAETKPEPNTASGNTGYKPPVPGPGLDSRLPPSIADVRAGRVAKQPDVKFDEVLGIGAEVRPMSGGTALELGAVEAALGPEFKHAVVARTQLYRRKPLLVEGRQNGDGSWLVKEAGREVAVSKEEFELLYELALDPSENLIDAGLPDLELGTEISKDGRRMVRVLVMSGKGTVAYWHECKNNGGDAQFRVTADMVENMQAAHRVGKFVEPYEGKPGGKTWVVVG